MPRAGAVIAGSPATTVHECHAVVDHDAGVRLERLGVDAPHLGSQSGTVRVRATVTDGSGTHTVDKVVDLVNQARHWHMGWDGSPIG